MGYIVLRVMDKEVCPFIQGQIATMRILVVEDEPGIAAFLRRGLEYSAYSVDSAETGEEALALLAKVDYCAVIMDLVLPGIDGLEVVRTLRRRRVQTPVIALTARADFEARVQGLEVGCDAYLSKPFAFEELLARLRALLRRTALSSERTLTCGPLTLEIDARVAVSNGCRVALTRREFDLLYCLMRQSGAAVSRTELFQSVWGTECKRDSNVVEVYINFLRQKLAPVGCAGLIRTVRNHGYKLLQESG